MSDIFHALASPVRREIIKLLKQSDLTAGEISNHFEITKPTLSGHLNTLKQAGLVVADKHKTTITYRLNMSVTEDLLTQFVALLGTSGTPIKENENEK